MSDAPFSEEEEEEGQSGGWIVTFADLMSLLLTFFVLLLSFSTINIIKFEAIIGSLKDAFGVQILSPGSIEALKEQATSKLAVFEEPELQEMVQVMEVNASHEALMEELENLVEQQNLGDKVSIEDSARGVILRVEGEVLFSSGQAAVKRSARPLLREIAEVIKSVPYHVSIEGHTDDIPINTARFPSNWELSTARAVAALRYLVDTEGIDRSRLSVTGYADTRPYVPNINARARQQNRRIEFVYVDERDLS